jgi:hypothetical protein
MSGMAAWGPTHDDDRIWNMVAFLRTLPSLTPEQYRAMTENADSAHEVDGHGVRSDHRHNHRH